MRINGRLLRPSTLAERRFLIGLGTTALKVPRGHNPYAVARRLRRAAKGSTADHELARELVAHMKLATPSRDPVPERRAIEPMLPDSRPEHGPLPL